MQYLRQKQCWCGRECQTDKDDAVGCGFNNECNRVDDVRAGYGHLVVVGGGEVGCAGVYVGVAGVVAVYW